MNKVFIPVCQIVGNHQRNLELRRPKDCSKIWLTYKGYQINSHISLDFYMAAYDCYVSYLGSGPAVIKINVFLFE